MNGIIEVKSNVNLLETGFDLSDEPLEGFGGEPVFFGEFFGAERGADEALEEERGVAIGLDAELVLADDDDALLEQVADALDDPQRTEIGGRAQVDVEDLLDVGDHAVEVARKDDLVLARGEDLAQRFAIAIELIPLAIYLRDDLRTAHQLPGDVLVEDPAQVALVVGIELELFLKSPVRQFDGGHLLEFHSFGAQSVLAVPQLDELTDRVAHRSVVVDHDRLHGFDEPALDVARFGRFDGRVDETFATAHGVEVELGRSQSGQVGILHETPRFGTVIVFDEVRQSPLAESKRDPFALHVLLTHAGNNLYMS